MPQKKKKKKKKSRFRLKKIFIIIILFMPKTYVFHLCSGLVDQARNKLQFSENTKMEELDALI